jgi:organic radical activating enzyme
MTNKVRVFKLFTPSFIDYPDNESCAVCVVMMGCTNTCNGCQNPELKNPLYDIGTIEVSTNDLYEKLKNVCQKYRTNKVVLSGGDPLSIYNIEFTKELLLMNNIFDICIYTGHNIEYVKTNNVKGFNFIKCGFFDIKNYRKSEKTDSYMVFASPNQKLYNNEYMLLSENGIYEFK